MKYIQIGSYEVSLKNFNKWLDALESGKFSQTKGSLQDKHGFCCLGVACKLFVNPEDLKYKTSFEKTLHGDTPDEQPNAPTWLVEISNDFHKKTGVELVIVNDGTTFFEKKVRVGNSFTFIEIAQLLRDVYIHKVLE